MVTMNNVRVEENDARPEMRGFSACYQIDVHGLNVDDFNVLVLPDVFYTDLENTARIDRFIDGTTAFAYADSEEKCLELIRKAVAELAES